MQFKHLFLFLSLFLSVMSNVANADSELAVIYPRDNDKIKKPLIVRGRAAKNSTLKVSITSEQGYNMKSRTVRADEDGSWQLGPLDLWIYENYDSASFTLSVQQTKPAKKKGATVIFDLDLNESSPRRPIEPEIISFSKNEKEGGESPVVIKGRAGANRVVRIQIHSQYLNANREKRDLLGQTFSVISDNSGNWQTGPIKLPSSPIAADVSHTVKVRQIIDGYVSRSRNHTLITSVTKE